MKFKFKELDVLSGIVKKGIINVLDISYGGEIGVKDTIKMSKDIFSNVKLLDEIKLLEKYFEHISKDTGLFCYGIEETIKCLESSSIEKLIMWDELNLIRYEYSNGIDNKIIYKKDTEDIEGMEGMEGTEYELKDKQYLSEWIVENYESFGTELELISNKSQEGNQFCIGFGGLGGILRWKVNMLDLE